MSDEIAVQQKLQVLFSRSMTLEWHTCNPDSCVKMNLEDTQFALDDAVSANSSCLQMKMNIDLIHSKSNFAANNINHLSGEPSAATQEMRTMQTAPQLPITPEQMIQTFLEQLSGSQPTLRPDVDNVAGGTQTQDTGNMINPDNLPADVCSRCIQGQRHCLILAKQDRVPFGLTIGAGNN